MHQTAEKSNFVTVLAWIFIVLAGFAVCMSIMQNIMFHFMFPAEHMKEVLAGAGTQQDIPVFLSFLFSNFRVFIFAFLVLSIILFICAIGLLKRKNWARIVFIVLMGVGILWNIVSAVLNFIFFSVFPMHEKLKQVDDQFMVMATVMGIFTVVFAVGLSVLFAWIIKKLTSKQVKAEFV
jgi:MFS family permease